MEKTLSGTEPAASAKPDLRKALLGLVGFFLVFFTTHWLLLWLHPMGGASVFLESSSWRRYRLAH
jgi:hypothetical protein